MTDGGGLNVDGGFPDPGVRRCYSDMRALGVVGEPLQSRRNKCEDAEVCPLFSI